MQTINNTTVLDKKIMRGVYGVWFVRRLYRNAAKIVVLFATAFVAGFNVSYASIFQNVGKMQFTFSGMSHYTLEAFLHTSPLIKIAFVFALAIGFAFVLDMSVAVRRFVFSRDGKQASQ